MLRSAAVACGVAAVMIGVYLSGDCDLSLRVAAAKGLPARAFQGERVWIVGASTGIGAALATELAKRGAAIALSSRRVELLEKVSRECGGGAVVPLDVLAFDAREKAAERVVEELGGLTTVVLNAGRSQRQLALDTPLETTREIMELNFFAVVALAKVAAEKMIQTGGGHVVVTSSISGKIGTPIASSYSASKFALHGYFDALRVELLNLDIRVTLVCPGPVVSDLPSHVHGLKTLDRAATKMPTQRCAELMAVAMYYRFPQVWISKQPELLFTVLSQYTPNLAVAVASRVGQKRVRAIEHGHDIFAYN